MDNVARLIGIFKARSDASVASKLDALMDIEHLHDPRVVQFLLGVMTDQREPVEVRAQALKHVRDRDPVDGPREPAAAALLQVIHDSCPPLLRLHAALALAEFTDIAGVPAGLGAVARDPAVPLDIRYSAFTSLQRIGPTLECVAALRQLLADEALGASARSLLVSWRIGELP
jgi:HEAT repeat protein